MTDHENNERAARDAASLAGIRAGGKARAKATQELYVAYRRVFLAYFMRNGVDAAQAEDLLQETFISIVRRADAFRGESQPSTWMWTIVRNRLIDHVRARKPESFIENEDGSTDFLESVAAPEHDPQSHSLDECVSRAFQAFEKAAGERAEVLRRIELDGWSVQQAATFLGRTQGATREYLSQSRKKFRVYLEPCREFLQSGG